MGHTIPPKRHIVYTKLAQLKKFADSLREPHRTRLIELANSVYQNISSIVYVNSLEDEEMMLYAMLVKLAEETAWNQQDKILRCLAILMCK